MQLQNILFSCLMILVFSACQKEKANRLPVANAGADKTLNYPVTSLELDGSASSAPRGTITHYEWVFVSGPSYSSFSNNLSAKTVVNHDPALKSLAAGTYIFELRITDNKGQHAKDVIQVTVSLKGQEFVFEDLVWEEFDDVDYGYKHIMVHTPPLLEFFHPESIYSQVPDTRSGLEVYLKLENTSVWIPVRPLLSQSGNEYFYYVSDEYLIVENHPPNLPPNTGLVGKKVSIKLKFL
jgi:hypothetical protein